MLLVGTWSTITRLLIKYGPNRWQLASGMVVPWQAQTSSKHLVIFICAIHFHPSQFFVFFIFTGYITLGDILTMFPYHNVLTIATMKGSEIHQLMEASVEYYNESSYQGEFLHVSGKFYTYLNIIPVHDLNNIKCKFHFLKECELYTIYQKKVGKECFTL